MLGGKVTQTKEKPQRFFSIELYSKQQIKNMALTNDGQKESTLIEGTIGNLVGATFNEGIILEVIGTLGTLRLDLQAKEIKSSFQNGGLP
jgi:glutamate synthase domain-containing protein 3